MVLDEDSHALAEEIVFLVGVADVREAQVEADEEVAGTELSGGIEDGVDLGGDVGVVFVDVGIEHGRASRRVGVLRAPPLIMLCGTALDRQVLAGDHTELLASDSSSKGISFLILSGSISC